MNETPTAAPVVTFPRATLPRVLPHTSPRVSPRVLLLGARGFIGSYVHRQLLSDGMQVVAVCRQLSPDLPALLGSRWLALPLHTMLRADDWLPHLREVDMVINCVGILRQRIGERYEHVHHLMPAALAKACAASCESGIGGTARKDGVKLIHTSALGLHEGAKSRFLSSKLRGEQAICNSGADYCIVRPSLIDGLGGFGASWLRMLASWPVHFVPGGARGRIAAVQASDLALAYAVLAAKPSLADWRQANLGGTRHFAYAEYLQLLRGVESEGAKAALQIPLPDWMSRIGSHLCDVFRFSPFSYGHWILLQRDNLAVPNALPALLAREPQAVTYSRITLKDDFRLS